MKEATLISGGRISRLPTLPAGCRQTRSKGANHALPNGSWQAYATL